MLGVSNWPGIELQVATKIVRHSEYVFMFVIALHEKQVVEVNNFVRFHGK